MKRKKSGVLSCPLLRLLKGTPRRHSPDEASMWGQTHAQAASKAEPFEACPSKFKCGGRLHTLLPLRSTTLPTLRSHTDRLLGVYRERKRSHSRRRASRSPPLA